MILVPESYDRESHSAALQRQFYGPQSFALELVDWIRDDAEECIDSGGRVWAYRCPTDGIVGYGSLDPTAETWIGNDGEPLRIVLIPAVALDVNFHGKPERDSGYPSYSKQIIDHLVSTAHSDHTSFATIGLVVHPENDKAIKIYGKWYAFQMIRKEIYYEEGGQAYFRMVRGNTGL